MIFIDFHVTLEFFFRRNWRHLNVLDYTFIYDKTLLLDLTEATLTYKYFFGVRWLMFKLNSAKRK